MSTLFVNNLNTASGSTITIPTCKQLIGTDTNSIKAPGMVVQLAHRDPTAAMVSQVQASSTSYTNTNYSITITPKYANSVILVLGDFQLGMANGYNDYSYLTLKRVISGGATTDLGHQTSSGANYGVAQRGGTNAYEWDSQTFTFPDKPNTTSAVTYQVWVRNNASSNTVYIGWTTSSNGTFPHNGCFLNAIEIAQ